MATPRHTLRRIRFYTLSAYRFTSITFYFLGFCLGKKALSQRLKCGCNFKHHDMRFTRFDRPPFSSKWNLSFEIFHFIFLEKGWACDIITRGGGLLALVWERIMRSTSRHPGIDSAIEHLLRPLRNIIDDRRTDSNNQSDTDCSPPRVQLTQYYFYIRIRPNSFSLI